MRRVVQVDKGNTICFEKATALFFPRLRNIWNHEVKTDDNITKHFRCFFKNGFVIRVSDIKFFRRTSAVTHADFFTQIDDFVFCRYVGVDEVFFSVMLTREPPRFREVGVRELDSSVKRELSLQKPVHLFIWCDFCDALFTMFVFLLKELSERTFPIACHLRLYTRQNTRNFIIDDGSSIDWSDDLFFDDDPETELSCDFECMT